MAGIFSRVRHLAIKMLLTIVIVITADTCTRKPETRKPSLGLMYSLFCISLSSIILLAQAFFRFLESGVEDKRRFALRVKLDLLSLSKQNLQV